MTGSTSEGRLPKVRGPRGRLRLAKAARVRDYLLLEDALLRSRPAKVEVDAEAEVDAVRPTPMEVATVEERLPGRHVVARTSREECWYVPVCSFVDWERVRVGGSVLLHPECKAVVGVVEEPELAVKDLRMEEPPQEDFEHIGGLVEQIREVKEAVEMPLIQPELYEEIGIKPPKGVMYDIYATFASSLPKCSDVFNFYFPFGCRGPLVLFVGWTCRLYGPPGTGKTLLAKAVAHETHASFFRIVGSELIQKYLGEGPRLVREIFKVAKESAPSIVFIDEIDAIGSKRYEAESGGEREVQRTLLELLNQLDGFDQLSNVQVMLATNRIDHLDPALLRPGRIDRKIELPIPDASTRKKIFEIQTRGMSLGPDVNWEKFTKAKELTGADIKSMCTEAGLLALRERRMKIIQKDFESAFKIIIQQKKPTFIEGIYL